MTHPVSRRVAGAAWTVSRRVAGAAWTVSRRVAGAVPPPPRSRPAASGS